MDKEAGNRQIYIITSGEYSDYCVHGYCTTEDKARERCAMLNNRANANDHLWATYHEYEAIECLDADEHPALLYLFHVDFAFDTSSRTWKVWNKPKSPTLVTEHASTAVRVKYSNGIRRYKVVVTVRENSEKLALKAAQDILYRQIAFDIESGEVFS